MLFLVFSMESASRQNNKSFRLPLSNQLARRVLTKPDFILGFIVAAPESTYDGNLGERLN